MGVEALKCFPWKRFCTVLKLIVIGQCQLYNIAMLLVPKDFSSPSETTIKLLIFWLFILNQNASTTRAVTYILTFTLKDLKIFSIDHRSRSYQAKENSQVITKTCKLSVFMGVRAHPPKFTFIQSCRGFSPNPLPLVPAPRSVSVLFFTVHIALTLVWVLSTLNL